jgi:hypothetical protein
MGWASPLRVATGGDANCGSEGRRRRSPAHANRRRDVVHFPMKKGRCGPAKQSDWPIKKHRNIPEETETEKEREDMKK